jgi:Family of unknown function (DUF6526)
MGSFMRTQTFANHVRYYAPHHFVFYPLLLATITASVYAYRHSADQKHLWLAVFVLLIFIGWSSFMMRQHYALGNQNRIVRLELRFRYYVLTGTRLESLESELSFSQMAALRFASDDELPGLIDRAIQEKLSPHQIKKLIIHWLPDTMRV